MASSPVASGSDLHPQEGFWERLPCCAYQAHQPPCAFTGNFEVGVHIADVSYFVPEGSDLDKVAAERATSVYLVQKVKISL